MHVPFVVKGGLAEALLQPAVSLIAWYLECGQCLPLLDSSSSPRTALPPTSFPWRSFGWRQSEEGSQKTHMSLIWSITTRSDHYKIITIRSEGKLQSTVVKDERNWEVTWVKFSFNVFSKAYLIVIQSDLETLQWQKCLTFLHFCTDRWIARAQTLHHNAKLKKLFFICYPLKNPTIFEFLLLIQDPPVSSKNNPLESMRNMKRLNHLA